MGLLSITTLQVLCTLHPKDSGPLRLGLPLPERALRRGLAIRGAGARLQWRRLQRRPDPVTRRVWVELCILGAKGRVRICAGHLKAGSGEVLVTERHPVLLDAWHGERVQRRWADGSEEAMAYLEREIAGEYQGIDYAAGEARVELPTGAAEQVLRAGVPASFWRRAGLLPGKARLGREQVRRLSELLPLLEEMRGPKGRGDYRRSGEVVTNLEFDMSLGLARMFLHGGSEDAWRRAFRSAWHSLCVDLDRRSGLLFAHGRSHRGGVGDLGHTWLQGMLLVGCLAAEDCLIRGAGVLARGLASRPASGEGRQDLLRERGWPLLEMEAWLRFAEDAQVAAACSGLVDRLLRSWDGRRGVFVLGEGRRRDGVYEEPLWVLSATLIPALQAYLQRTEDPRIPPILRRLQKRLCRLIRQGREGLPLRYCVGVGEPFGVVRMAGTASGCLLLEGVPGAQLPRILARAQVQRALEGVLREDDPDLVTSWAKLARCTWIYR